MTSRERKTQKFLQEANNIFMDANEYDEYELVGYCRLLEAICDQTEEILDGNFCIANIQEALATLDKRQYNILRLRYWDWHTFASIGTILSVSHQRIHEINSDSLYRLRRLIHKNKYLEGSIPIEALELNNKGYKALKSLGINTIEQLMKLSKKELLCIKGVGRITAEDIKNKLERFLIEVVPDEYGNIPIEVLGLSDKGYNALKCTGINTIEQLMKLSQKDLLGIKGVGRITAEEIKHKADVFMIEVAPTKQVFFERLPIDTLKFSERVNNALKRKGVFIIKQLFEIPMEELISIKGIGPKGVNEILNKKQEAIAKYM